MIFDRQLDNAPYFTDHTDGARNNWNGEVGYRFTP